MFQGEGCTISQAAAELVSERMEGLNLEDIEALEHDVIIDELGREVVMSRPRCATLALGTLKQAVHDYKIQHEANEEAAGYAKDGEAASSGHHLPAR